jgi:protoheme IX farnesyltransferase
MPTELPQHGALTVPRSRLLDYLALTKPELTLLSVLTAIGAAMLAMPDVLHSIVLLHVFVGTALVGASAGTLNQYAERNFDAMMKRTEHRPLPSGGLRPVEALVFGIATGIFGIAYLAGTTTFMAGALACITLVSYVLVYTPLKRRTPFATVVGGIPGALPPLIGWAAVHDGVSPAGWSLFFVLFFWQMPHFLALAWMYRKDYARAGYRLLTVLDPEGVVTSRQILVYAAALVPASLMPTLVGITGVVYFAGALVLSVAFAGVAVRLYRERSNQNARRLFFASLAFLPALFGLMLLDRIH